jgi:hypothetical protein
VVPPKELNLFLVDFRDGVGLTLEVVPVRGVFMVLSSSFFVCFGVVLTGFPNFVEVGGAMLLHDQ